MFDVREYKMLDVRECRECKMLDVRNAENTVFSHLEFGI
jgi:hypothetical protein